MTTPMEKLGDLVCDCMDAYRLEDQWKLHNEQDSPAMTAILNEIGFRQNTQ